MKYLQPLILCAVLMSAAACGKSVQENSPDATPVAQGACADYCTAVTTNCSGANAQYADMNECLSMCETQAAWPEGMEGETGGNTVACRTYHAGVAGGDPDTHCSHAGPSGGSVCGDYCENYCHVAVKNCAGTNVAYADLADCMTNCAEFETDGEPGAIDGNSVQCRIYHAGAPAADSPATHCNHASPSGGEVCGSYCDVYCDLLAKNCTGANAIYASDMECRTACAGVSAGGNPGDTSGDSIQCRIYHAGVPAAADATQHCPHAVAVGSPVCN